MSALQSEIKDAVREVLREAGIEKLPDAIPVGRRVFTLERAAEYLDCSPRYVQHLVSEGKLRTFQWSSKRQAKPYFDVRDLDEAVDAMKRKGEAQEGGRS